MRAIFEAVADFDSLVREGRRAETQLDRTKGAAKGLSSAYPADGGPSERGLRRLSDRVGSIGTQMTRTGRRMTLGISLPIAAVGVGAVRSFASFEKALVSAQLKAGASEAQFKRMKALALDMGAKTSFSAGQAATSLDQLAALGFDAEQAMKTLPAVMQAAQAAGEDLGVTTDVVARAMNAFNIKASQSEHVADVFANAANTSALNMQGLSDALGQAGEIAPRFHQSLEDVVAVIARMVDQGVPAASAGAAIRQALVSLSKPTMQAGKLIDLLGIQIYGANGKMLPIPKLLGQIERGLTKSNPKYAQFKSLVGLSGDALKEQAKRLGLNTTQAVAIQRALKQGGDAFRNYALGTLFGTEGAKAFSLALAKGKPVILDTQKDADKLDRLQQGLAKTMGTKGAKAWIAARTEAGKFKAKGKDAVTAISALGKASDDTSKKMSDAFQKTTAQKIDNLVGSLQSLGIELISDVEPGLKKTIDRTTKLVNKIGEFSKKHDWAGPVIVGAGLLLVALGPVLIAVGKIATGIGAISKAGRRLRGFGAGGTGAGAATALGQRVYWTEPLPVYMMATPIPTTGKPPVAVPGGGEGAGKGVPGRFGRLAERFPRTVGRLGKVGAAAGKFSRFFGPGIFAGSPDELPPGVAVPKDFDKKYMLVPGTKNKFMLRSAYASMKAEEQRLSISPFIRKPLALGALDPRFAAEKGQGQGAALKQRRDIQSLFSTITSGAGASQKPVRDLAGLLGGLPPRKSVVVDADTRPARRKISAMQALLSGDIFGMIGLRPPGMSRGGLVGGGGRGDTQVRRLDPKEFVVTADAVEQPGVLSFLKRLNAGVGGATVMQQMSRAQAARIATGGGRAATGTPTMRASTAVNETGGRSLTIPVYNPAPERSSQSVSRVLRRVVDEEGWGQG